MDENRAMALGGPLQHRVHHRVLNRIAMHGREKAGDADLRKGFGFPCTVLRIQHRKGEETVGIGAHGGGNGFMIAREAGHQRSLVYTVRSSSRAHVSASFSGSAG